MIVHDSKGREVQLQLALTHDGYVVVSDAYYIDPHVQAAGDDPKLEIDYIMHRYRGLIYAAFGQEAITDVPWCASEARAAEACSN